MDEIKTYKNYALWKFFPLLVFVFSPKIDVISIPNYWQGVRADDLVIFFYSIYFFFQINLRFILI